MTPRPAPSAADYAEADRCLADFASKVDPDWFRQHYESNRHHFAMAEMQKRQNAELKAETISKQSTWKRRAA